LYGPAANHPVAWVGDPIGFELLAVWRKLAGLVSRFGLRRQPAEAKRSGDGAFELRANFRSTRRAFVVNLAAL